MRILLEQKPEPTGHGALVCAGRVHAYQNSRSTAYANWITTEGMQLMLVNQSSQRIPRKFLQKWVKDIARLAVKDIDVQRYRDRELVVAFLDEKPARELNKQYRGKNYATDVLSFESEDPSSLGELVICPQVIAEQAKEHGLTMQQELGYMVLHGFLHLLGYDHEGSEDEAELMFELQDRLFDKLLAKVVRKPAARRKPVKSARKAAR